MSLAYQQAFDSPELTEPVTGALVLFDCPRHAGHLRLSENACAGLFRRAQKADLEIDVAMVHCRSCLIGASHAGMECKPPDAVSCVRCEIPRATRLIGRLLCVSCTNRQMEIEKGRNARGLKPTMLQALNIYIYYDSKFVVGRGENEAGRVMNRMQGEFKPELLVSYGEATPSELRWWWQQIIMPWSSRAKRRLKFQLNKKIGESS
jgi:hypothetical protein